MTSQNMRCRISYFYFIVTDVYLIYFNKGFLTSSCINFQKNFQKSFKKQVEILLNINNFQHEVKHDEKSK